CRPCLGLTNSCTRSRASHTQFTLDRSLAAGQPAQGAVFICAAKTHMTACSRNKGSPPFLLELKYLRGWAILPASSCRKRLQASDICSPAAAILLETSSLLESIPVCYSVTHARHTPCNFHKVDHFGLIALCLERHIAPTKRRKHQP